MASAASVGGRMGIYDRDLRAQQQPFAAWGADPPFRPDAAVVAAQHAAATTMADDSVVPAEDAPSSDSFGHDHDDAGRPSNDKALRRLAQNREAARKSRLRKKAYIQTLESSRLRLAQLEQELAHVRRQQAAGIALSQQGVFVRGSIGGESAIMGLTPAPAVDSGIVAFETEYARWVDEQARHAVDLRAALLHSPTAALEPDDDARLRALVDAGLAHYDALFRLKSSASAASTAALLLHVLSGAWRSPAERLFLWIGGFRPSETLAALAPQLGPMEEREAEAVRALRQTARQLEDALSQGLDKLRQTLTEALLPLADDGDNYAAHARQMDDKLEGLASFVDKADHLRQQTLRNMRKILTPRQAARGLLALADYCQRLRALSSLWAARPREPA